MSYELECIKRVVLSQTTNLPSDDEFLSMQGCSSIEEFFENKWKNPAPCFFIWVNNNLLFEIMGTLCCSKGKLNLVKVDVSVFEKCITEPERLFIDGESGFYVSEYLQANRYSLANY